MATYAEFTIVGRVLTDPKKYEFTCPDGERDVLVTFIAGTIKDNAKKKISERYNNYNIKAYKKTAKSIFCNVSKGDYVLVKGTPETVRVNGEFFYTEYIVSRFLLLNRSTKSVYAKKGVENE
jgi:single-stranded DNA-binding protein